MKRRAQRKRPGKVTKVIKDLRFKDGQPSEIEKAQIELHDGDHLYREIRIENELQDESGKKSKLKKGDDVEVTIEADSEQKPDK